VIVGLIQAKSRRRRSFARIFSRTSESSTKSSRTDLPHSEAMVLRVLDTVVNVVMEIVLQTGPIHMAAQVVMEDTATHPLPIPRAVS
jgi:hypothetical protein